VNFLPLPPYPAQVVDIRKHPPGSDCADLQLHFRRLAGDHASLVDSDDQYDTVEPKPDDQKDDPENDQVCAVIRYFVSCETFKSPLVSDS
jgi:hypothetical protein